MDTGLMVTIGVLVLVGIFGLIILWDRKRIEQKEARPNRAPEIQMTPTERWDAHVERLQKRGA